METTISSLQPGQSAIVKNLRSHGQLRQRLFDMGLTPNTKIRMVRLAPLGDPMEIRLRGYSLSLRKAEGDEVVVEIING